MLLKSLRRSGASAPSFLAQMVPASAALSRGGADRGRAVRRGGDGAAGAAAPGLPLRADIRVGGGRGLSRRGGGLSAALGDGRRSGNRWLRAF